MKDNDLQQRENPVRIQITIDSWCGRCKEIGYDDDNRYCKRTYKNFGEGVPCPAKTCTKEKECPYYKEALQKAISEFCVSHRVAGGH